MISILPIYIGATVVIYAGLWSGVMFFWRPRRLAPQIPPDGLSSLLTVVIAARNESGNIGPCLRSILNQKIVSQVIVVDDHSTDDTRQKVARIQQGEPRLTLLKAPELPSGWVGKSHALHFGAKEVKTAYLLFTDADVIFGRGILAAAILKIDADGLDHLGGHFYVDCQTIAEEICAPILTMSSGLALMSTSDSLGASTGAFNLVRTAAYRAYDGHTPFKNDLVDDVALARHLKAAGAKSQFMFMDDRVKVRLFIGFSGFFKSVARSAVPFLRMGGITVCLLAALCMVVALLPLISMVVAIHSAASASANDWTLMVLLFVGALPYGMGLAAVTHSRQLHNGRLVFHLLYPFALFLMAASVFWAAINQMRRRPVSWRGRDYIPD